jgi:hypothetical protein
MERVTLPVLCAAGGPCGVLAAVQAHLIATLMQQQLWHPLTPPATAASTSSSGGGSSMGQPLTQHQLHEALITSLSLMLWGCACSSSSSSSSSSRRVSAQVATIPRSGSSSAGLRGLCDAGQVLRMVAVSTAHSLQELQVRLSCLGRTVTVSEQLLLLKQGVDWLLV